MKILRKIFAVCLIFLGIFIILVSTSSGLKTLFWMTDKLLGDRLTVGSVTGNSLQDFEVSDVEYKDAKFSFRAKKFAIKNNLWFFFDKNWKIQYLHIEEGLLTLAALPESPIHIQMNTSPERDGQFLWDVAFQQNQDIALTAHGTIIPTEHFTKFEGDILNAQLSGNDIDQWQLKNPSHFLFTENQLNTEMRFQNKELAELFLQVHWDKNKGGTLSVDIPDFALKGKDLQGKFALQLALKQTPAGITGKGELRIKPGAAKIPLSGNRVYDTHYQGGKVVADWQESGLKVELNFQETERNYLSAELSVPGFSLNKPFSEQKISGTSTAHIQDVSIAYLLAPQISRLKAIVEAKGKIRGTLAQPMLQLDADLHDAIFSIPKQRVIVREYQGKLTGEIPGSLQLKSKGTIKEQPFYLNGTFGVLAPDARNVFEFWGENLRIYNTANIHVVATPKLQLEFEDNNLLISGTVQISEANIVQKDELTRVITSTDVVFTDDAAIDLIESLNIIPDIDIFIEDENKVRFHGFGLDAILRGKLKIEKRPDGLLTGTGRLTIKEGKYKIQGSVYHINRGHLLYPPGTLLNDPILEIRIAKRKPGHVEEATEVGIYVQGSLQSPNYHLYATDDLQNTEILSRLGFGGSQIEGEDGESQLVTQTAQLLADSANPFIESLQKKLELEEISIQSAESQRIITTHGGYDTVLVVGKSLSKNIYVQFIQGMLEPLSLLRLKYFLTPRIAVGVETSTMESLGGDLSFSMEGD